VTLCWFDYAVGMLALVLWSIATPVPVPDPDPAPRAIVVASRWRQFHARLRGWFTRRINGLRALLKALLLTITQRWTRVEESMTPDKRAKVVELLLHAAKLEFYKEGARGDFLRSAAIQLSATEEIADLARQACCYVSSDGTSRPIQLAAAARVANRSWP